MSAEESLVGAALLDSTVYHEAALKYNQFLNPICSVAWKAIGKCLDHDIEADPITVADACEGKINPYQLSEMVINVGVTNTQHWADIVRNAYIKRGVAEISSDFTKWESQGYSGPDMLAKVRQSVERLEDANEITLPTLAELAATEVDRLRSSTYEKLQGLPTGGLALERAAPAGFARGCVITFFSESGNFKSTAKNCAVRGIADAGYRVLDCSFEDPNSLTAYRYIAGETGHNYGSIAAGTLSDKARSGLELSPESQKSASNVILAGGILPNIDEIIRTARYYKSKGGMDAVVIDYVQLLEGRNPRQSPKELLDEIMRKAQLAAVRDNMAYIVISQVKQDVNQRTNHHPQITDMLGSSAMRTASKLMVGCYRPSYYHDVPAKGSGYEKLYANHPDGHMLYKNMLELHLLKNVLGAPNVVLHCNVNPGTGVIVPFDMKDFV